MRDSGGPSARARSPETLSAHPG